MDSWLQLGSVIGGVFLLDLILSGDNALVIGVAAAGLPQRQKTYAFLIGGAGAIGLRIILTSLASILLNIPFLQTIGAIVLLYLACKLLNEHYHTEANETINAAAPDTHSAAFRTALKTIIIADVTMSLDNILAVGALSNGDFLPLAIGLAFSITILLLGSAVISIIAEKFRWLLNLAAIVLGWTSATMIADDLHSVAFANHIRWLMNLSNKNLFFNNLSWLLVILGIITCGIVIGFNFYIRKHNLPKLRRPAPPQKSAEGTSSAKNAYEKVS